MNIKRLIPKDKFDFETVEKLKNYSFDEIKPIIPNLLEWLQDGNWPISKPVGELLLPFTEKISPEIAQILQGHDSVWKYWILQTFGKISDNELVQSEIERILKSPTKDEIAEGIFEMANLISK